MNEAGATITAGYSERADKFSAVKAFLQQQNVSLKFVRSLPNSGGPVKGEDQFRTLQTAPTSGRDGHPISQRADPRSMYNETIIPAFASNNTASMYRTKFDRDLLNQRIHRKRVASQASDPGSTAARSASKKRGSTGGGATAFDKAKASAGDPSRNLSARGMVARNDYVRKNVLNHW